MSIKVATEGPVVNVIKDESPLVGVVDEGDMVVSIDDIDTSKMSGDEISELMAKTTNTKRTITLITKKGPNRHTMKIEAPKGKLGLLIKITSAGPAVNTVKDGSPLKDVLRSEDVILSIDDAKTTSMSAQEISGRFDF